MNSQLREKVIKLRREQNFSYTEIRERLGVPKSTLSYWLREFPLAEEQIKKLQRQGWRKSEVSRERFRNSMREKRELRDKEVYNKYQKRFARLSKDAFFIAGLMLYLGEGGKQDYARISLANTDPKIIKFFIKWLIIFFDVYKEEIKIQLHLYENMDIGQEEKFWQKVLGFNEEQFYKSSIRKLQKASFSYRESYRHGTCSLYVLGVKKKRELTMAIQAFIDKCMK